MVAIRPLNRLEEVMRELLQTPLVEKAKLTGTDIEVEIKGDEKASAAILTGLIQKGFDIVEFKQRRADLETVFMNITKGEVQ